MKPLLLALLVCAACKHSTSSSSTSHTEATSTTETRTEESGATTTTTTVTEAPGETTTTVSEYAPPEKETAPPVSEAAPNAAGLGAGSNTNRREMPTIPRHGPLVKRTVTVTRSGGETTQTRQEATSQATGATETKAAGKSDVQAQAQTASAPAASCVSLGWLYGVIVLVALLGIGYFALKFRKAIP